MNIEKLKKLKRINAAYIASLEFDYCPGSKKVENVEELCETGLDTEDLSNALDEFAGERPDEIVRKMSNLIASL